VRLDEARQELDAPSPVFEDAVMELVDEGRLEAAGDERLCPSSDARSVQRHTVDGTTYRIEPVGAGEWEPFLAAVRETDGTVPRVGSEALTGILRNERGPDDPVLTEDAVGGPPGMPDQASFLATVEETEVPVGWAHVRDRAEASPCRTAWVAANVRRPYRRRGLGRRLLVRCVGWAAVHGFDRLYTTVDPIDDETVAFLESRGWELKTLRVENRAVVAAKLEVEV
jgi:GNAT superfamily N-acetyltransferase